MKVLAIDPGVTTGLAWAEVAYNRGSLVREVQRSFSDGTGGTAQLQGHDTSERSWRILEFIIEHEPDVVVAEDFVLFVFRKLSMLREGLEPHAINANLRMFWWMAYRDLISFGLNGDDDMPKLVWQMASEKEAVTDRMLREWKLWRTPTKDGGPHAMDALRHLLVYIKKEGKKT